MSALLSHAELTKRKGNSSHTAESRRATRVTRHGNLTLFPRVEPAEAIDHSIDSTDESRVVASLSNVSTTGVGLIVNEELPAGLEFDVAWPQAKLAIPLRFEVVHSQIVSVGMYRIGARLVAGVLPGEPISTDYVNREQPDELSGDSSEAAEVACGQGVLKYEPEILVGSCHHFDSAPVGTLRATSAFGFEKTETLNGTTACGWERSVSLRREGDRLWVYVHSSDKKTGWGLYVDASDFEAALGRVQLSASTPFVSTLAA